MMMIIRSFKVAHSVNSTFSFSASLALIITEVFDDLFDRCQAWLWLQYEVRLLTFLLVSLSTPLASPLTSLHHHQAPTDFLPKTAWTLTG